MGNLQIINKQDEKKSNVHIFINFKAKYREHKISNLNKH